MKLLIAAVLSPLIVFLIGAAWIFILIFPPLLLAAGVVVGFIMATLMLVQRVRKFISERVKLPEVISDFVNSQSVLTSACACVTDRKQGQEVVVRFVSAGNIWSHRAKGRNVTEAINRLHGKLLREKGRMIRCGARPCINAKHCPFLNSERPARAIFSEDFTRRIQA
jgi:hypothetical protein